MNNSLVTQYGFNKDREGIHKVDLLSQLSRYLYLPVLNSAQSSGNNWKFHKFTGVESHCNGNGILVDL